MASPYCREVESTREETWGLLGGEWRGSGAGENNDDFAVNSFTGRIEACAALYGRIGPGAGPAASWP